jgi:aminoglycoside phosphotransferase (APT) family kinase protein
VVAVPRSPLVLAALASAAVPGLHPCSVRGTEVSGNDFDTAVVTDSKDRRWVVRAPQRAAAGAQLESEMALLAHLADPTRATLPFAVPAPAGSATLPEGGRCVVYPYLPGSPLHPGDLAPGPGLAAALGRALATLHDVPRSVVEDAGMPVYEATEYRERRLSELDRAASTGHVPARLLARWEKALEDVGRWRFQSCVVHGDLVAEHVLVDDGQVVGMLDWSEARVADPADDLAWIAVGADSEALDSVLESYAVSRTDSPDRHLAVRARLAGELALARWLLHGVRHDDASVVDDATLMLRDLSGDVGEEPL